MIGICRLFELRGVTCGAVRQNAVLPADNGFVTSLAFHRGVRSDQRKEILMIADLLPGREPPLQDMALSAIGAEFSEMNIGMTVGAILTDVAKYQLRMTLGADYFFVPPAQRVMGLVVIEFGRDANRGPTVRRMAILAPHG